MKLSGTISVILGLGLLMAVAPTTATAAKKNSALASALLKYDTNKNGVLDAEEIEALKKDYVNNKPDALKKYDANNNGQIDESEVDAIKTDFAAAVAKHRKKKKESQ